MAKIFCSVVFVVATSLTCLQGAPLSPTTVTDAPVTTKEPTQPATDAPVTTSDAPITTTALAITTSAPPLVTTEAPTMPPTTTQTQPATTQAPTTTMAPTTAQAPPTTQAPTTAAAPTTTSAPPVDGMWSDWDTWSQCSKTCGSGAKSRIRYCTNPVPSNGGQPCSGASNETQVCNTTPCPINGRWTDWGQWELCSTTCGTGTKRRLRTCIPPQHGGLKCQGQPDQTFPCKMGPCPIDGGWSQWGDWTACTASCGDGGMKNRTRTCTQPAPNKDGKPCNGSSSESVKCDLSPCPVDGDWSDFRDWSECSKPCGGGDHYRERTCTNPTPAYGGKLCLGNGMESEACNTHECTVSPPAANETASGKSDPQAAGECDPPKRSKAWMVVAVVLLIIVIILILVVVYLCAKSIRNKGEGSITKEKKKKEDKKRNGKEEEIPLEEKQPLNEENANA